jgi:hypothetical protein
MPIEFSDIVQTTTTSANFRSLTISQGKNGDLVMNINYSLDTVNQTEDAVSSEQVSSAVSDSEIRSHPEYSTVYAILRDICRTAFVRDHPEFLG